MSDMTTPWTVAQQAPLSMEFSRQEYWSGLLFPIPGVLLDPRIEPHLLHLLNGRQIPYGCATWETHICTYVCVCACVCIYSYIYNYIIIVGMGGPQSLFLFEGKTLSCMASPLLSPPTSSL